MASKLLRLRVASVKPDQSQYKMYDVTFEPEVPTYITTSVKVDKDEVDLEELIAYVGSLGIVCYAQSLTDADTKSEMLQQFARSKNRRG